MEAGHQRSRDEAGGEQSYIEMEQIENQAAISTVSAGTWKVIITYTHTHIHTYIDRLNSFTL